MHLGPESFFTLPCINSALWRDTKQQTSLLSEMKHETHEKDNPNASGSCSARDEIHVGIILTLVVLSGFSQVTMNKLKSSAFLFLAHDI
jgi:hypothetical protein